MQNLIFSKYLPIFDLSNNPDDFIDLSYSELEQLINSKKSPFKRLAINKTQPTICLETLLDDGITIEDQKLLEDKSSIKYKLMNLLLKE